MTEKEIQEKIRPLTKLTPKFLPTSRSLLNFVNKKARGKGIDLTFNKVLFLDKAEKSTYTLMSVELNEFKKQIGDFVEGEALDEVLEAADKTMAEVRSSVKRVYGEVRRYIVASELRSATIKTYFRAIPSLSREQNAVVAKEMFTLAYEDLIAQKPYDIRTIVQGFHQLNKKALALFAAADSAK